MQRRLVILKTRRVDIRAVVEKEFADVEGGFGEGGHCDDHEGGAAEFVLEVEGNSLVVN